MSVIRSQIRTDSEEFQANEALMRRLVESLRETTAKTALGGSESARGKHQARGKLLVRDRIDAPLDPAAPFLELSSLAAHGLYRNEVPSAGLVTGIGRISGRECMMWPMTRRYAAALIIRLPSRSTCARRSATFALLYGVCETMNGNWASLYMKEHFGAGAAVASPR